MSFFPVSTVAMLIFLAAFSNGDKVCNLKPRVYDIDDFGNSDYFHGWVDVQGQGAANDYCRVLGNNPDLRLECVLAGEGRVAVKDRYLYESAWGLDLGYKNTWYMKDENGDGRDDYCRCVGNDDNTYISCSQAGPRGFYGSKAQAGDQYTFTPAGGKYKCQNIALFPEFGKKYVKPRPTTYT